MSPTPATVWALSDGRAGNRAQALGLAEAVARASGAEIADIASPPGLLAALLPPALSDGLGRLRRGWPFAGHRDAPAPPWPDLVIGAGRRIAPMVAAIGRRGARTVQVLDPRMRADAFGLLVVPEHDGVTGPRVVTTLGAPGRVTPARVAEAAAAWEARIAPLPAPRLAVLIGGSGRMARWRGGDAAALRAALARLAAEGWTLLVTASRRTDPALAEALAAGLDPDRHLLHLGEGENPYPAILGHADAVLVTADSVNMASEAASAGLPVHVFPLATLSEKARRFHAALEAHGASRPFEGAVGGWRYPPLAEADRVAALILARLFPAA